MNQNPSPSPIHHQRKQNNLINTRHTMKHININNNNNKQAEDIKVSSENNKQQEISPLLLSIIKKRTYSTILDSKSYNNQIQQQIDYNGWENELLDLQQSQLSEDGDTVSNQARYLSYLDFENIHTPNNDKIDNIQQQQDQKAHGNNQQQEQYEESLRILYRSIIYLRKQEMRCEIDDVLLLQDIGDHIKLGTSPEPITPVGNKLFSNGYFLAALVILQSRRSQSPFLLGYLFKYFDHNYQIAENQFEYREYASRNPQSYNLPKINLNTSRRRSHQIQIKRSQLNQPNQLNMQNKRFSQVVISRNKDIKKEHKFKRTNSFEQNQQNQKNEQKGQQNKEIGESSKRV